MYLSNTTKLPAIASGRVVHRDGTGSDLTDSPKVLRSSELLGQEGELLIEHNGCQYSLRLTRQNKLILTK